ncbi:hypothetical protein H0H81_006609 [Sphagnurus paluster]|uniref:Uncharacterized protein n=1 Tax=Sphagnurus paluster TaxID=117069 RepID=A0A9P7FQV0_9AGAR|nr:hypothetical protein H0H81_006609 [Sphagnurus paluster]
MSAAASCLSLEHPSAEEADLVDLSQEAEEFEKDALERLIAISPPTFAGPIIAVDLDDVLSQTNEIVAQYYYYWKNPLWGTAKETFEKIKDFYATDFINNTNVVPGARQGVQTLRDMGFRLIIVTARREDNADESWQWVNKHFPGIFDSIICTGQFKDAHKIGHEVVTKLNKAQVCADLGARLLIDDSAENALQCSTFKQPTPVLLFGDYEWNKRLSGPNEDTDDMVFARRLELAGGREFWREETFVVPEGAPMYRVKDWSEVVRWVSDKMGGLHFHMLN